MRSSPRLAAALAALALALTASLGLKLALARSPAGAAAASAAASRGEALRRFLATHAGPVETLADGGWQVTRGPCRLIAFPSGPRGTLDLGALRQAGPQDRIAYVYRGHVSARRPGLALALDIALYLAAKPFRAAGPEPGYVVLMLRHCPTIPDLPWAKLPT